MHLLITLGSSWAVVPEAFLLGNGNSLYSHVTVITTSGTSGAVKRCGNWFSEHHPEVTLRIYAISNLPDITSGEDHHVFEEALFRCYFSAKKISGEELHLCLAGGFKTMSSAAHQAADLIGCQKLFHVIAPFGERFDDHDSILKGIEKKKINLVDLGSRSGWPTISELQSESPPLPETSGSLAIDHTELRNKIFNRLESASRLSASEHELATLPFPQIARWSPSERAWLDQALDPETDVEWIQKLPKIELHCHLGGFATHGELLAEVEAVANCPKKLPSRNAKALPEKWPLPSQPCGLDDYMKYGDNTGSRLLKDPGCLKKHIQLLYQHLQEQNILYAEIRCSPANYTDPESDRSSWKVLEDIQKTFQECMVATCVPHDGKVAASVPDAVDGQARHPFSPSVGETPAATTTAFVPYNKDAEFSQTWRNLPHRHQHNCTAFLTFRLADSLPAARLQQYRDDEIHFQKSHPKPWSDDDWQIYQKQFPQRLESWLDKAHGECLLAKTKVCNIVEQALRHFDGERYILDHFVIMPNHVHVLVKPIKDFTLKDIVHSWKSYTAHEINKTLNRTGSVWQKESFDHLLRSQEQLQRLRIYIDENPQKSGLKTGCHTGHGIKVVVAACVPHDGKVAVSVSDTVDAADKQAGHPFPHPTGETPAATATHVNLIIIATRREKGDYRSDISRHLALACTAAEQWTHSQQCRVVGVDLAGYENIDTRAHYFREEFTAVHRCGLALTIHAGENDDAEGIWSAVFDLNTRRIGHALHLIDSPTLMRSVADRRIGIEMCPYANHQIKGFKLDKDETDTPTYPLLKYLEEGLAVTVNTDNPGISTASLCDNFLLLARLCPKLKRIHILQLLRNAVEQSFSSDKSKMLSLIKIPHPSAGLLPTQ